jgi:hypothetical protein
MWLLSIESVASLLWVVALAASLVFAVLNVMFGNDIGAFGFGLAWGTAISVVATLQLGAALLLSAHYDPWDLRSALVGAIYPVLFWLWSAAAALRSQITALFRGPREEHVVWDIPREQLETR